MYRLLQAEQIVITSIAVIHLTVSIEVILVCFNCPNESVFAMAGYSVFRHAGTEVDFYFIVEDNICRLIFNVQPGLKPNKDLLPIAPMSSPAIANTFVGGSYFSVNTIAIFFRRSVLMFIVTGSSSFGMLSFLKYSFLMLSLFWNTSENILILILKFIVIIVSVVWKDVNV